MHKKIYSLCLISFFIVSTVLAQAPLELQGGTVVAEGLNGPQGLHVDSANNLWIAESGLGGNDEIAFANPQTFQLETAKLGDSSRVIKVSPDGKQEVVATLPSVVVAQDTVGGAKITELNGEVFVTSGQWIEFNGDKSLGTIAAVLRVGESGAEVVADTWAFENEQNPDGINLRESHPYGITPGPDGHLYIADAAANSLLRLDVSTGGLELVAAFEPLPGVFPNPVMDNAMLAQAVPTAAAFAADGTLYVSYLSGAPFVPGSAKVVKVSTKNVVKTSARGEVSDFATGLTMLTDLKAAPDGNLYATQFAIFGQQGPQPNSGAVIRIRPNGSAETVIAGLPFVTAIAFNTAGEGFVAINGVGAPGSGQVVRYHDLLERAGSPVAQMGAPQN